MTVRETVAGRENSAGFRLPGACADGGDCSPPSPRFQKVWYPARQNHMSGLATTVDFTAVGMEKGTVHPKAIFKARLRARGRCHGIGSWPSATSLLPASRSWAAGAAKWDTVRTSPDGELLVLAECKAIVHGW